LRGSTRAPRIAADRVRRPGEPPPPRGRGGPQPGALAGHAGLERTHREGDEPADGHARRRLRRPLPRTDTRDADEAGERDRVRAQQRSKALRDRRTGSVLVGCLRPPAPALRRRELAPAGGLAAGAAKAPHPKCGRKAASGGSAYARGGTRSVNQKRLPPSGALSTPISPP